MVSCLHRSDYKCMCINPSPVCLNRLGPDVHREFSPLHKVGFVPSGAPVVSIHDDMSWMLSSCGVRITSGRLIGSIADKLESVVNVVSILSRPDMLRE